MHVTFNTCIAMHVLRGKDMIGPETTALGKQGCREDRNCPADSSLPPALFAGKCGSGR